MQILNHQKAVNGIDAIIEHSPSTQRVVVEYKSMTKISRRSDFNKATHIAISVNFLESKKAELFFSNIRIEWIKMSSIRSLYYSVLLQKPVNRC